MGQIGPEQIRDDIGREGVPPPPASEGVCGGGVILSSMGSIMELREETDGPWFTLEKLPLAVEWRTGHRPSVEAQNLGSCDSSSCGVHMTGSEADQGRDVAMERGRIQGAFAGWAHGLAMKLVVGRLVPGKGDSRPHHPPYSSFTAISSLSETQQLLSTED